MESQENPYASREDARDLKKWLLRSFSALCLTVLTATVIVAVGTGIDSGVKFELDGNATVESSHDWNQVYADNTANPKTNTAQAIASSFITDAVHQADDILVGGGTKDPLDFPNWLWKETATSSVQDKDDIEHAYAAAYTLPNGHTGIFFGADRLSNSGSSQMGFWFVQDPNVAINTKAHGGASGGFNGQHTVNDLLIVAHFVNGGAIPQITLYKWVGGSAGIEQVGLVDANLCNPATGSIPDICAITNTGAFGPTWTYTEKPSDSPPLTGVFMEGGIDLQNALGTSPCFNVFFAETRASQSETATLSDFTKPVPFVLCSIDASKACNSAAVLTNPSTGANTVHYTFTGTLTAPQANVYDPTIKDTFPTGATNTHLSEGTDPSQAAACTPTDGACTIKISGMVATGGPGVSYIGSFDMAAPLPASDALNPSGTNPNRMTATAAPTSGGPQTVSLTGANYRLWVPNDAGGGVCHISVDAALELKKGCVVNIVPSGGNLVLEVDAEIRVCNTKLVSEGGVQLNGLTLTDDVFGTIGSNLTLNAPSATQSGCRHFYPFIKPSTCAPGSDGRCTFSDTVTPSGPVKDFTGKTYTLPLAQSATCRVCPLGACSASSDTPFPDPGSSKDDPIVP